jgi:hypothetical protein
MAAARAHHRRTEVIAADAGVDPSENGAFTVGVNFVHEGDVHVTMTPLVHELSNQPPTAICNDVVTEASASCEAVVDIASVDGGSFDPDGDELSFSIEPASGFPLGTSSVTLTVDDGQGGFDSCEALVTVEDLVPPVIECNAPSTVTPPMAPMSFSASATDNCGVQAVEITAFDCFKTTKKGRRVDKTESCVVEIAGATITILDSGGVGDTITWDATAADVRSSLTGEDFQFTVRALRQVRGSEVWGLYITRAATCR